MESGDTSPLFSLKEYSPKPCQSLGLLIEMQAKRLVCCGAQFTNIVEAGLGQMNCSLWLRGDRAKMFE
jgi:hypothetical protein